MKKILIIKHGSLGDITFAIPSMISIRKKYPNALIHLLTEKNMFRFYLNLKFLIKLL